MIPLPRIAYEALPVFLRGLYFPITVVSYQGSSHQTTPNQ